MSKINECKWCRPVVAEGIGNIDDLDDEKTVSEDLYEERLAFCMECTSLQYGTTCKHSGCIVSYRAFLKEKNCPYPRNSKW